MRTEARFDSRTDSFILHTPDFEAAKCWAGCLGILTWLIRLFLEINFNAMFLV